MSDLVARVQESPQVSLARTYADIAVGREHVRESLDAYAAQCIAETRRLLAGEIEKLPTLRGKLLMRTTVLALLAPEPESVPLPPPEGGTQP